jgi:putative endonuclease
MTVQKDLGEAGEQIAFEYLINKGYYIKERNWRYKNAEIDIIATHNHQLIIVEVKTRSAVIYEEPRDAITDQKIRFLTHAAEEYIIGNEIDLETRFDVIAIKWFGKGKYELQHIEDAFTPMVD